LFSVLVNGVKDLAGGFYRQRRDVRVIAKRRDSGDAGSYTKGNVLKAAQLVNDGVYFVSVSPRGVEDGFCVIQEQDHLPR
jgi:hypothetical protein